MSNRQKWADLQGRYSPLLPQLSSMDNDVTTGGNAGKSATEKAGDDVSSEKEKKGKGKGNLKSALCSVM